MSTPLHALFSGLRVSCSRLGLRAALVGAFLLIALPSAWADSSNISLPDGWAHTKPTLGELSVVHTDSLARIDVRQTKLPQAALAKYRASFQRRLVEQGFKAGEPEEMSVQGNATTKTRYTRKMGELNFGLVVFETYKGGVLWHVAALVPLDASAAALEADAVAVLQKLL